MRICVLGDIRASMDGGPVLISNERQQRILAALLMAGPGGLSVDSLEAKVWDEGEEPPDPVSSLRTYVNRLRNSIGDGSADLIATRPGGYAIGSHAVEVDAHRFETLSTTAERELDPHDALALLDEALALWSGPAFRDIAHVEWVIPEAVRLEELRLTAHERRLQLRLDVGRHGDVAADAERLLAEHPYREGLRAIQVVALYRAGRQVEALDAIEEQRRVLRDELGIDPPAELRDLEERILNQDPDLEAPSHGGRPLRGYRLAQPIGEGAFSIVYRAIQPSVGREVAVKVIRKELANEPAFIQRFEAEAQLVARLQHPRVVPLYDFWREADRAYLVMPWLEGGSVADRLRSGPLTLDETVPLITHVAAGLDFAHRNGIIHRDVKPSNVLLDREGNAYISDFGIALVDAVDDDVPILRSVGSPAYAAPEQFADDGVGPAADTFSLAVMAYELLAGGLPWPKEASTTAFRGHRERGLPPLALRDSHLAAAIDEVLARATATDPAVRPQTSSEFAGELADLASVEVDVVPQQTSVNPYRGLAPFQEPDAPYFFGREDLIAEVMEKLDTHPVVLLVGPSGSGKSSLLRAGVIPAARSAGELVTLLVPGDDPLGALTAGLEAVSADATLDIRSRLDGGVPVDDILADSTHRARLVVAIDQLEEIFTLAGPDAAEDLLAVLADAAVSGDTRLMFVATIRADFYGHLLSSPGFGTHTAGSTIGVGPMRTEQLAAAIVEPARRNGVDVDDALVAALATDAAGRAGALPFLQFALTRAWDTRSGSRVTLDDYEALGGLTGALASSAEDLYNGLDSEEQGALHRLLPRLVQIGDETTRRREQVASALSIQGVTTHLIEKLVDARLVTLDRDPATREPTIELSHEAIVDAWPRLGRWVSESRSALATAQRTRADAADWEAAGRDPDLLYTSTRLATAGEAAADPAVALATTDREFLEAASERQAAAEAARRQAASDAERQRRRRWIIGVAAALAVAVGVAATVAAVVTQRRADSIIASIRAGEPTDAVAALINEGDVLIQKFLPVVEGRWRVESLGTPFNLEIVGEWWVQNNTDGFVVFTHPDSDFAGDRDVVFIRPMVLVDPTDANTTVEGAGRWPLSDIEGWLDRVIDGVVATPAAPASIGGLDGLAFEVELAGEELCGPESCVMFVAATDRIGKTFDPGFRYRVYWLDQGELEPIVIVIGAESDQFDEWLPVAESLLESVVFGAPAPHPDP